MRPASEKNEEDTNSLKHVWAMSKCRASTSARQSYMKTGWNGGGPASDFIHLLIHPANSHSCTLLCRHIIYVKIVHWNDAGIRAPDRSRLPIPAFSGIIELLYDRMLRVCADWLLIEGRFGWSVSMLPQVTVNRLNTNRWLSGGSNNVNQR